MSISNELLNILAVLSQGRLPSLDTGTVYAQGATLPNPPSGTTPGIGERSVSGAVIGFVRVDCRTNPSTRTSRVTITLASHPSTYRVTVAGNNYDYVTNPGDTVALILAGLQPLVDASPDVAAAVVGAELVITGTLPADYVISVSMVAGAGTIALNADATAVTFEVWGLVRSGTQFRLINNASGLTADRRNFIERLVCAGLDKVLILPTAADGRFTVFFDPCVEESG